MELSPTMKNAILYEIAMHRIDEGGTFDGIDPAIEDLAIRKYETILKGVPLSLYIRISDLLSNKELAKIKAWDDIEKICNEIDLVDRYGLQLDNGLYIDTRGYADEEVTIDRLKDVPVIANGTLVDPKRAAEAFSQNRDEGVYCVYWSLDDDKILNKGKEL